VHRAISFAVLCSRWLSEAADCASQVQSCEALVNQPTRHRIGTHHERLITCHVTPLRSPPRKPRNNADAAK
jgi:hypothetical protein